jgi:hypothetical protein
MTQFFHRFFGALVLDSEAFEDIERDRHAAMQSVVVVMAVCAAAGIGAVGLGAGVAGFLAGTIIALGAFLVWAAVVMTLGTVAMPEPTTNSNLPELLRVLGFAAAPGVFIAFIAMRSAAPMIAAVVAVWLIAAGIKGVRQALDYRSVGRAAAVCVISWLLSLSIVALVAALFTGRVS